MKMETTERAVIRDWKALPETERQTINQAWRFVDMTEGRYAFRSEARPSQAILGSIAGYQFRIGKPLKFR